MAFQIEHHDPMAKAFQGDIAKFSETFSKERARGGRNVEKGYRALSMSGASLRGNSIARRHFMCLNLFARARTTTAARESPPAGYPSKL